MVLELYTVGLGAVDTILVVVGLVIADYCRFYRCITTCWRSPLPSVCPIYESMLACRPSNYVGSRPTAAFVVSGVVSGSAGTWIAMLLGFSISFIGTPV